MNKIFYKKKKCIQKHKMNNHRTRDIAYLIQQLLSITTVGPRFPPIETHFKKDSFIFAAGICKCFFLLYSSAFE